MHECAGAPMHPVELGLFDQSNDEEQHHGADGGGDDGSHQPARGDPQHPKEPSADDGADPTAANHEGQTALDLAKGAGVKELLGKHKN